MSLWLYDPIREMAPYRRGRHAWNPFRDVERSLDQFFNSATQELQLRDHAGQIINDDKGFQYRVDCRGFSPEELKVDVEGNTIVIKAEHRSESDDEMVHRSFSRRVTIPKDCQKENIKCDLDESGRLVIMAPKAAIAEDQKRSIPIEFKKADDSK